MREDLAGIKSYTVKKEERTTVQNICIVSLERLSLSAVFSEGIWYHHRGVQLQLYMTGRSCEE